MRAIICDFDGVLVESVDIKTEAFRELFKDHPQYVDEFAAYHQYNGGVSRFEKIKYFYTHFLKQNITEAKFRELVDRFSQLVCDKVVEAPYVKGAKQFLDLAKDHFSLFVVSGTPQEEMRQIVERRGMTKYFKGVFGSPRVKSDIVREDILQANGLSAEESVLIGDSVTDLKAAQENGMRFIARVLDNTEAWFADKDVVTKVKDLDGLFEYITRMKVMAK